MASALLAKCRLTALLSVIDQDLGLVDVLGLAPRPGLRFVQCLALLQQSSGLLLLGALELLQLLCSLRGFAALLRVIVAEVAAIGFQTQV